MVDLPPIEQQRILAIFAHPDDEVFCAGGTLAYYASHGAETIVISATQGQAGQIQDMQLAKRATLGEVRCRELHASCEQLGVKHVECWEYPDGALATVPREQVTNDVVQAIQKYQPHIIITFDADGAYGHPDHIAIHEITTEAFFLARDTDTDYQPMKLYYSAFPHRHDLLLKLLVDWLMTREERFFGTPEYVAGLNIFAKESTMLNYVEDFVETRWYTPNFCILEQGEAARDLFVILSGTVDVYQEDEQGDWHAIGSLGVGAFFGEVGIAENATRNAHVVARDSVTCLVFSPQVRTNFEARGQSKQTNHHKNINQLVDLGNATHVIDVRNHLLQKVKAIASHRTQFGITENMFPLEILEQLFGQEYFVQTYPKRQLDTLL